MTDLDALLDLEHAGWRSLCEGTGGGFYGSIMSDDALMILAHGLALDRDAVIASLCDAPPWRRYEITTPRLVTLGTAAAALVYTGRGWREGADPVFTALMSSTYRRLDGSWRLALYQQTPIPSGR